MRSTVFSKDYPNAYFEILVWNDKNYSFLKQNKIILQQPSYSQVTQVATGQESATFVNKTSYFIYKNGQLSEIDLKKKAFEKTFSNDENFESYLKSHSGSFNEQYVINIFTAYNAQQQSNTN